MATKRAIRRPSDGKPSVREPRAPDLSERVQRFGVENEELLEAMRLFGVTIAEYERALRALWSAPIVTASSSSERVGEGPLALVE